VGRLSAGLSVPAARMVWEVLVGIQARGSVRLSEIGRALNESTALRKVIERVGRHLRRREVREQVRDNLLALAPQQGSSLFWMGGIRILDHLIRALRQAFRPCRDPFGP